jgi:hypothetical protein
VSTKPSIRSRMKSFGSTRTEAAGAPPAAGSTISVMFRGREGTFDATIVDLLASQRGRRIALVRLAIENGPLQDDLRAPWFPQRPDIEEWVEVAQFPASLQQACFPREKDGGS